MGRNTESRPAARGVGIIAYSWINALGRQSYLPGDAPPPYRLARRALAPHAPELGLEGRSGQVTLPLSRLPSHLLAHESRCAELLLETLNPFLELIAEKKKTYARERIAVILGTSTGGIDATERAMRFERQTGRLPEEFVFEEAHVYHALIRVVREVLGIDGVGYVVSTACSSSGKAMGAAQRLLDSGAADLVLTGGVDALCEMTLRGFAGLGILDRDRCHPFGQSRKGISIGEGAALLLLEREDQSPFRLLGVGESNDAYHATAPHPEGLGAILAMTRAMEAAGIDSRSVGYVNAHGTGTEHNDAAESRAIAACFPQGVAFSSTKDRVGHQMGTAGATEAIFCLESLASGILPENDVVLGIDESLAQKPLLAPLLQPTRVALSNSFAFGGSNVCVVLAHDPVPRPATAPNTDAAVVHAPGKRVYVRSLELWSEEFEGPDDFRARRLSPRKNAPSSLLLGARQRGRASVITRIFAELFGRLEHLSEADLDATQLKLSFGSAYGEMETTLALLDQMDTDLTLSPAKFQGSVHNTAVGVISLARENRGYASAVAAGESTFAMTLLDAMLALREGGREAFALAADERGPPRMLRGRTFPALGLGVHLIADTTPPTGALFEIELPEIAETISRQSEGSFPDGLNDNPISHGLALFGLGPIREPQKLRIGPRSKLLVRPL